MKLRRGITGFRGESDSSLPTTKFDEFHRLSKRVSHTLALPISEINSDGTGHNYYYASFACAEQFALLCNAQYPLVTFVSGFVAPHEGQILKCCDMAAVIELFSAGGYFEYLDGGALQSTIEESTCQELAQSELDQIAYWRTQTIGEVIYNHYD